MASYINELLESYEHNKQFADTRTRDWLLVHRTPVYVWLATAAYLLFVTVGPKLMANRKAMDLRGFMFVYNIGLVGLSLYMFIEILASTHAAGYFEDLGCAPHNAEARANPLELRIAKVMWWYFFSKVIEFLDTVLMVLRQKNQQISFLHVFHHASMLNIWWWVVMFIPGGNSWFGSSLNCLVHVVMYTYYGLSVFPSLHKYLWWKKYLTKFQLLQFVCTLTHTCYTMSRDCDFPRWGQMLLFYYMIMMLTLFGNFYIQAYIKRKAPLPGGALKATKATHAVNGVTTSSANGLHSNGLYSNGHSDIHTNGKKLN